MKSPSKICLKLQRSRRMLETRSLQRCFPFSKHLRALYWPDSGLGMSLSRYSRGVHRMGCLQSFLWNFVARILQRLPLGSKARKAGPAYSGIKSLSALLDLAAVLKTAPESQLVKGPPGRLRELSTVRYSRTQSGLPYFL